VFQIAGSEEDLPTSKRAAVTLLVSCETQTGCPVLSHCSVGRHFDMWRMWLSC